MGRSYGVHTTQSYEKRRSTDSSEIVSEKKDDVLTTNV